MKALKLILAYVLRFIHNLKRKFERRSGPITTIELETANRVLIVSTESIAFLKEIHALKTGLNLSAKSRLIPLKPLLDKQGILRVGGRLINSELPEEQKHQILLPSNHHLIRFIIREEQQRLKHAGTQATLYSVHELFWPLDGKNITRKISLQCVRCFRAKPRDVDYVVGDLPQERVSYSRPFHDVGVDYCGPLDVKEKRFRNRNKLKVYICIFFIFIGYGACVF